MKRHQQVLPLGSISKLHLYAHFSPQSKAPSLVRHIHICSAFSMMMVMMMVMMMTNIHATDSRPLEQAIINEVSWPNRRILKFYWKWFKMNIPFFVSQVIYAFSLCFCLEFYVFTRENLVLLFFHKTKSRFRSRNSLFPTFFALFFY